MATLDTRYARALALVVADQKLDPGQTEQEVNRFAEVLAESAELREVLNDPSIPEAQKMGVLNALGDRLGLSKPVRNFIAVIARHGRIDEAPGMFQAYAGMAETEAHVAEVEIVSARPLDEAGRKLLEEQAVKLSGGDRVKAVFREDASLLGGAMVKIGSTVYDGSVRAQLEQLKHRMVTAIAR